MQLQTLSCMSMAVLPFSNKNFKMSTNPFFDAKCIAPNPSRVCSFEFAPCFNNSSIICMCPFQTAKCRLHQPSYTTTTTTNN